MRRHPNLLFSLIAVVLLTLGMTLYQVMSGKGADGPMNEAGIVLLQNARPLPAMVLTSQLGEPVAMNALKDQWTLLFFGYTYCPDVCPTTLAELRQLRGQLSEAQRGQWRVILVSLDPLRDTPQQLKQYLGYFDPSFQGATGATPAQLQSLTSAVGIPYVQPDTRQANYTVEHSGNLVIVGPDGQQRGFIRAPLNVQKLVVQLPLLMQRP